jgi:hypothetical protein
VEVRLSREGIGEGMSKPDERVFVEAFAAMVGKNARCAENVRGMNRAFFAR